MIRRLIDWCVPARALQWSSLDRAFRSPLGWVTYPQHVQILDPADLAWILNRQRRWW